VPRPPVDAFPDSWRWRSEPAEPGPTVVFDMDGVLSDASGRQHYLEGPIQYWDAFFAACDEDAVLEGQVSLGQLLAPELVIVLLTARPLRVRRQTLAWLDQHPVRWDLLIMRDDDLDLGTTSRFKRDAVRRLNSSGYEVVLAFEDDPRNVAAFRGEGVPTVYVHSGYYG
jgi:hypothetical protein